MTRSTQHDDWLHVKRVIDRANKEKQNIKKGAVKDIGKSIIERYKVPQYELIENGKDRGNYRLDANHHKIPKMRTDHGKKIPVQRKVVSFADFSKYYKIVPRDPNSKLIKNDNDTPSNVANYDKEDHRTNTFTDSNNIG